MFNNVLLQESLRVTQTLPGLDIVQLVAQAQIRVDTSKGDAPQMTNAVANWFVAQIQTQFAELDFLPQINVVIQKVHVIL